MFKWFAEVVSVFLQCVTCDLGLILLSLYLAIRKNLLKPNWINRSAITVVLFCGLLAYVVNGNNENDGEILPSLQLVFTSFLAVVIGQILGHKEKLTKPINIVLEILIHFGLGLFTVASALNLIGFDRM